MVPKEAWSGTPDGHSDVRRAAYSAILDRSGDLVLTSDWATARFVDANPAALRRLGYTLAELAEMTGGDLSEFPRDVHRRFSQELIDEGHTHASAIPVRCRDGSLLTMDLWVQRFETEAGTFHVTVLRDTATAARPRARSEFALDIARIRESEAFYRGVVTCTEDAVVVTERQSGTTIEANPAACSLFGRSTVAWREVTRASLCPDAETREDLERELAEHGRARRAEIELRRADGRRFFADTMHNAFETGGRNLVVTLIRDVTERRRLRLRFERAQRLAAVGEVAAGVAHEINNPAAFALLNCQVLGEQLAAARAQLEDTESESALAALRLAEEAVADTQDGLQRVVAVAKDLRQFWRDDEREVAKLDVNEVVNATLSRLRNEIRHRARLELDLADDLPPIAMRRGKLDQVLTNILLNAAQAIVEGQAEANLLRIETRRADDTVVISVSDTGEGMEPATLDRMFEPFFSTKSTDEGAGLGMALSAEIIEAHGGRIQATSTVGLGSTLRVIVPVETGLTPRPSSSKAPRETGKRILVVDDDPGMVRAYRRILRDRDAIVVDSGRKALELLETDPSFDLIVCDLMMPDVDGPALHEALTKTAPHLAARMVFCTGGAITPRTRAFVDTVENEVLNKPLGTRDLERLFS